MKIEIKRPIRRFAFQERDITGYGRERMEGMEY